MAQRHDEFLERGGRLFGLSSDTPGQNAAVIDKLALPFPILADPDRDRAITPLGFADEDDPRQIARPGVVLVAPDGEIAYRTEGRDYADRPDEDDLLNALAGLDLDTTTQDPPVIANPEPGEKAINVDVLPAYFRGARFAVLAIRGRHRDLGEDFRDDTKEYVRMADRYLEALSAVEDRRA